MKTLTTSELRNDLFNVAKSVTTKNDIVRVAHKTGDYVLISADVFDEIEETLYLYSDPNFSRELEEAREEVKAGKTVSLEELKKQHGL